MRIDTATEITEEFGHLCCNLTLLDDTQQGIAAAFYCAQWAML